MYNVPFVLPATDLCAMTTHTQPTVPQPLRNVHRNFNVLLKCFHHAMFICCHRVGSFGSTTHARHDGLYPCNKGLITTRQHESSTKTVMVVTGAISNTPPCDRMPEPEKTKQRCSYQTRGYFRDRMGRHSPGCMVKT